MLDWGAFKMRPGVLELIAAMALSEVEGTCGIGVRRDHPEDLKKRRNLCKGIKKEVEEGTAHFEIEVCIDYGKDFHESARAVQYKVKTAVENMTGWNVEAVDVNIVGVNAL